MAIHYYIIFLLSFLPQLLQGRFRKYYAVIYSAILIPSILLFLMYGYHPITSSNSISTNSSYPFIYDEYEYNDTFVYTRETYSLKIDDELHSSYHYIIKDTPLDRYTKHLLQSEYDGNHANDPVLHYIYYNASSNDIWVIYAEDMTNITDTLIKIKEAYPQT